MKAPLKIRKVDLYQNAAYQMEGLPFYAVSNGDGSNGFHCSDHCQVYGFCYPCELSSGGMELCGFGNSLFVNYNGGLEAELRIDDLNFNGKNLEEIFNREESFKYYRGEIPEEACHYDPFPEKTGLSCNG